MASIQVTPEMMRKTSKEVDNKITEWNNAVNTIYKKASEMDQMWDGLGNDSFNKVFSADQPKFKSLTTLMSDYSKAINEAAKLYDTGEQEVAKIVQRKR